MTFLVAHSASLVLIYEAGNSECISVSQFPPGEAPWSHGAMCTSTWMALLCLNYPVSQKTERSILVVMIISYRKFCISMISLLASSGGG